MELLTAIKALADELGAELKEKKGVWTLKAVVAERKSFLNKKKLEYIARLEIDDAGRVLRFSELLKESGSGMSSGGFDSDLSPGFGFKKESYKTGTGPREGNIEEQPNLFGQKYDYRFDFKNIRASIEQTAAEAGYRFEYHLF